MSDYLLDTNIVIDYLRGIPAKVSYLNDLVLQGGLLHSCDITVAETFTGMREPERKATEGFLESLRYVPIDYPTAQRAGDYRRLYKGKGKQITLADALVASVAVSHNLVLVTDNLKDYPMEELKKEKP